MLRTLRNVRVYRYTFPDPRDQGVTTEEKYNILRTVLERRFVSGLNLSKVIFSDLRSMSVGLL